MQTTMEKLASTLSRQRGIQYELRPEFTEYSAQKASGTLEQTHLKPPSEIFTLEELNKIPIDNKVGENYFQEMSEQLGKKGGSPFHAIGQHLVLSSDANLAFSEGLEKMLWDKELKSKKEIDKIEAEWSRAQKDHIQAKVTMTNAHKDNLAREQSRLDSVHWKWRKM